MHRRTATTSPHRRRAAAHDDVARGAATSYGGTAGGGRSAWGATVGSGHDDRQLMSDLRDNAMTNAATGERPPGGEP